MSRSKTLRPTSPSTSIIGMSKPYTNMYTHHHFTDLEKEYSNFLQDQPKVIERHTLQSFTDPSLEHKSHVLE